MLVPVAVFVAVVAIRTIGLYGDLQTAQRALTDAGATVERAGFSISAAEAHQVKDELAAADTSLMRAGDELKGDPFLGVFRIIPPLARQIDSASALIDAAHAVTGHSPAVTSALDGYVAARDSTSGSERLAAFARLSAQLRPQIDELASAFIEADRLVETVPTEDLLDPLSRTRSLLAMRLAQVRPLVEAATTASKVLPSIMGVGDRRRYLVLALDNAEVRPIGGLIGAFAIPSFDDGRLTDMAFRDILSIDRKDQKQYVAPPQPLADHLLGAFTWQVADAGWWPDFADSVKDIRRLYAIETGKDDTQGVIAFTPELVDRLLAVVGPVTVEGAGITVEPGQTYLVSLEQVEVLNRGEGRKAFLASLASQVLERLFALPPSRYPEVFAALDEAGKRRQLQVLFDDSPAQVAIDGFRWPGAFTFPAVGDRLSIQEANVAPVSKLDVLLSLDHSLDVQLAADGSATERLVTTYTNHFGPKLSPELERVRSSFFSGILGSYSRRYLVPDADVTNVASDDPSAPITDPDSEEAESGCLAVGNYQFVQPGTVHLTTEYFAPHVVEPAPLGSGQGETYRLTFRKQAGRDHDTLTVRVTIPNGRVPTSWSEGGTAVGRTITFSVTTEFDHTFLVSFAPG